MPRTATGSVVSRKIFGEAVLRPSPAALAKNFIWGGINFKSFQFQNQQQFVLGQREKKQPVAT